MLLGIVSNLADTCEVSWQTSRDNLIAASLFFSSFSLIAIVVFIMIFVWSRKNNKVRVIRMLRSVHKINISGL